jgi:hypothetical protein
MEGQERRTGMLAVAAKNRGGARSRMSRRQKQRWLAKQRPILADRLAKNTIYPGETAMELISARLVAESEFSARLNRLSDWYWDRVGDYTIVSGQAIGQLRPIVACSKRKADDPMNEWIGLQVAMARMVRQIDLVGNSGVTVKFVDSGDVTV